MSFAPGTRLGAYEILSPLGAGGMGEVYKARDTRLDRTVAIKVLPEAFAGDPQFRERFDREARAISQLSHPHICTLHDVGESDDGVRYLVMEHLDGETLADRLIKGRIPIDEALRIATQIADALTAAHRHDIVHRDLKPGNVVLTKGGAKLLDFGLAKTTPAIVVGESAAATLPRALTAEGAIVGTVQYMAPEQLDGRPADARTDIFAFGAVLYEMISGRKAFDGRSPASVIGAIMTAAPPSMSAVGVPPAPERIVTTCLAKDPDDRWQSARDLSRELQWIAGGAQPDPASQPRPDAARLRWTGTVAWIVAAALAAAVVVLTMKLRSSSAGPPARLTVALGADASMPVEVGPNVAFSPDGNALAFVALTSGSSTKQLYLRRLDQLRASPLPGTENAREPFFSPHSQSIAFFDDENRKLKTVSVAGGPPVTL
jgi:serine/threonine protein kinase